MKIRAYLSIYIFLLLLCSCNQNKQSPSNQKVKSQLILVGSNISSDTSILNLIAPYKIVSDSMTAAVIGNCKKTMKEINPEGPLNNFVLDLLIHQANLYLSNEGKENVDISMINYHGLRAPIRKGDITIGNVFEVMPFENKLTILEVNGANLLKVLNHTAQQGGLAFGGMKIKIENKKIKSATIGDKSINPTKIYRIATSDYVAQGGDKIISLSQISTSRDLNLKIRDAIIQEIEFRTKNNLTISATIDGRINVK